MARNVIESEFRTSKIDDRSEMDRDAIKSDFRPSKMAAEKKKFRIDLKWPELCYAIESDFRTSNMASYYNTTIIPWPPTSSIYAALSAPFLILALLL